MKVYFMRHGESEYNVVRRINYDPKKEVHLTLKGRDQVERAAEKLRDLRFDAIFSSQLIRARETAAIVAKGRRLKVKIDKRLNEIKWGLEGEPAEEYYKLRDDSQDIVNFKIKNGESFVDLKKRIYDFLMELKKKKYARVLVVGHEGTVQAAKAIFNELGDEDAFLTKVRNAEYFMFDM